jgi:SNF2 family DNA or RNA helicase
MLTDINCISKSKLPLKEHQKRLIYQLRKQKGILAIHAVGSGKTLTAVTASQCYLADNPNGKVIVVTPASLQINFKKEMKQYNPNIKENKYEFYTYDGFVNADKIGEIDCTNAMLIVDEAHNIRTAIKHKRDKKTGLPKIQGKKAHALVKCALNKAKKVLLLTATPIVNETRDLINLMAIINGTNPISETDFKFIMRDERAFTEFFRCKISIYEPCAAETKEFYPDHKIQDVFISMPLDYQQKYEEVERSQSLFFAGNPNVFYNGVRRACNKIDDSVSAPKIKWINNFLDINPNGKIVIFSNWLDSGLTSLKQVLTTKNISYLYIDGSLNKKTRAEAVKQYNEDKIRVLLISRAGGEGLDLKGTRFMILFDPGWNPAGEDQVIGRGIRFKSHYHLPLEQQMVDVFKLYLVKDEERRVIDLGKTYDSLEDCKNSRQRWSTDLYLRALSRYKRVVINNILDKLRPLSIEKSNC